MVQRQWLHIAFLCCQASILLTVFGCEPKTSGDPQPTPATSRSLSTPFSSEEWSTPFGKGQRITSRHYTIYTTVHDPSLLATLPGFMEAAYQNYLDVLQQDDTKDPRLTAEARSLTDKPLPMYMMASRAEWEAMTINRFGQAGPARVIESGGYTFQGVTVCWAIGRTATLSVASHEGMHQFLYHALKNRLPLWAEEGLATTAEGFVLDRGIVRFTPDQNLMRLSDLRNSIINGTWLDLPTLLTTNTAAVAQAGDETKTVGYYGQLYALMTFLRHDATYGPKWRAMLQAAREGGFDNILPSGQLQLQGMYYYRLAGRPLFEHYITTDLNAFEADFQRFARQLVKLPPRS